MNRKLRIPGFPSQLTRENTFVLLGLVFVFLIFAGLTTFVFISNNRREQVIMKYQAEQVFSNFLLQFGENPSAVDTIFRESSLIGIGIYDQNGNLMRNQFTMGEVPSSIDLSSGSRLARGDMIYHEEDQSISFVRRAQMTYSIPIIGFTQGILDRDTRIRIPEALFIKMEGRTYRDQYIVSVTWYSIALVMILIAVIGIWKLYYRNSLYRLRLAEQEQLARLGEAARTLTHEIKNPLSAITIQNAYLKKTLPAEYHEEIKVIEDETQRLNHLTGRISEFLRNPQGEPEDVAVSSFLKDLMGKISRDITFHAGDYDSARVRIDRQRFRSVMENLLKNALESREDAQDPEVTVRLVASSRNVTITIADRGDGIPFGEEKKLFDPFYTTKIHGSGIGLAISLRFVEAAGGTLRIHSRDGGGTLAVVKLPGGTA